jgi:hypothetical protein
MGMSLNGPSGLNEHLMRGFLHTRAPHTLLSPVKIILSLFFENAFVLRVFAYFSETVDEEVVPPFRSGASELDLILLFLKNSIITWKFTLSYI